MEAALKSLTHLLNYLDLLETCIHNNQATATTK